MSKPREFSSCACGASIDLASGESCQDCTTAKYTEVWSHRVSPEFRDFKALMFGTVLLLVSCVPAFAYTTISLEAIAQIESSGDPSAIGDNGKALGLYQLHKGVFQDYNKANKTKLDHRACALEPVCATAVADWYLHLRIPQMLTAYRVPIMRDTVLTAYNMGIVSVKRGKRATRYIKAYQEAL